MYVYVYKAVFFLSKFRERKTHHDEVSKKHFAKPTINDRLYCLMLRPLSSPLFPILLTEYYPDINCFLFPPHSTCGLILK